ncbi:putative ankyrin repeat-containing domain [Rosellinia necatrix]|uniref:Putative ankyrin repeat-containing domain n=1 Tax=Rosellinia necatrix TaxID=77044 RepID=A0A1S8A8X0_ROSNE|nr:putative ankyrin repeat-containing domain [Rosellinia necatrix]
MLDRRSREPSCVVQTLDMAGPKSGKPNEFISLVMPFIHVDHVTLNRRDSGYVGRTKPLRYCISDHHTILERHMPLTLDEYCSPALSTDILKFRNGDQVLGRHQRSMQDQNNRARMPKNEEKEAPTLLGDLRILMSQYARKLARRINPGNRDLDNQQSKKTMVVDPPPMDTVFVMQAWIWRIGDYVITTSPPNNDDELRIQLLEEDQCLTIALILGGLVDRFDNRREKEASLLKTYENALSVISEGVSQYVGSVLMEDIDLEQEKDFIHQISDLREELSMIKSVLAEQEDVWKEFIGFIWPTQGPDQQPSRWRDTGDRTTADSEQLAKGGIEDKWSREHWRVQSKFNKYRRRISKLEQDAERVERNISTQLDLKQKHATMKEAHSTAIMSAAVFGFTIITIIFAPLSFMAALFALPIDMFNQGKRGNEADGAYSSNYIGKWSATAEIVSIVVTLVAMWAALQFADLHIWGKKGMREWVRQRANNVYIAERRSHRDTDPV